jgi:hypothetical protein
MNFARKRTEINRVSDRFVLDSRQSSEQKERERRADGALCKDLMIETHVASKTSTIAKRWKRKCASESVLLLAEVKGIGW